MYVIVFRRYKNPLLFNSLPPWPPKGLKPNQSLPLLHTSLAPC